MILLMKEAVLNNGKRVLIVGAGQHCHVVLYNMEEQQLHEAIGIGDIDETKWGRTLDGKTILQGYKDFDHDAISRIREEYRIEAFFLGLGAMKVRRKLFEFFIEEGWESVNIIHPNAVVSKKTKMGTGVLIEAGCLVTPAPFIGDNVVVNTGSQVNHDNIIESHVYIASGVVLSGGVQVGENTLIDDSVTVALGRRIGKNCIIGAGSVVTKDIPDGVIAYGNPCKVARMNDKY